MDLRSFSAELNCQGVTRHFTVTQNQASAQLSIADGLRAGLGKNDQVAGPNLLKITLCDKVKAKPCQANRHFFLLASNLLPRTSGIIGAGGGQVVLPGYGSVSFPAGAFDVDQRVELIVTADPVTDGIFLVTAFMFGAQSRLPYEFRINTGGVAPKTSFQVSFEVPLAFR